MTIRSTKNKITDLSLRFDYTSGTVTIQDQVTLSVQSDLNLFCLQKGQVIGLCAEGVFFFLLRSISLI